MDEMVRQNDFSTILGARHDLLYFLIPVQVLFTFVVFIFMIFLTHKIAGPLYKLQQHLKRIQEGAPVSSLSFRNGDHFQELAEDVSTFLETVASNQEKDFQYLDEVTTYLNNLSSVIPEDKKPVLNEIGRRLEEIKSRYRQEL
jgi:sensor histidine kinase YesM